MTSLNIYNWQQQNEAAIKKRLAIHLPDKELAKIIPSDVQGVFIRRIDDVIELYCYEPESYTLSNIMSRVNLTMPLDLMATYNQVLFLTHVWQKIPAKRMYIAGFGGGRLGMLPHHFNSDLYIDGSDFDPAIVQIASDYFGIEYDERYSIKAADSAQDFNTRTHSYDVVIIDVFSSSGGHASHLASKSFFQNCYDKITQDGVVAINLIDNDPALKDKQSNLQSIFPHILKWHHDGSHLLFGSKSPIMPDTLISRAERFENDAKLTFPYSEHAKGLEIA